MMEWSIIRKTSITAPKPQDMTSRKLRLKTVNLRFCLAMGLRYYFNQQGAYAGTCAGAYNDGIATVQGLALRIGSIVDLHRLGAVAT